MASCEQKFRIQITGIVIEIIREFIKLYFNTTEKGGVDYDEL